MAAMTPPAVDQTLTGLRQFGETIALESADLTLTYRHLADAVDELATRLLDEPTISPGAAVLVTSRHTARTVTMLLACAQAHVTYVPISDDISASRLEHIRSSVQPVAHLIDDGAAPVIELVDADSPIRSSVDDVLAVLHTSGSTGTPKSVAIERYNLNNFLLWCRRALPLQPTDRLAILSPLHFDLCTHDIYHGLYSGSTLVIPNDFERTNSGAAARFVAARDITRMYMVPTFLERVATALVRFDRRPEHVRCVMFAGERLTRRGRESVEAAFPAAMLHNLYGPIETNVVTALELQRGTDHDSSQVGHALPGLKLGIRHPDGTITPEGRGELTVTGPAVTPGYLDRRHNDEKLTVSPTGDRTYRTGDEATLSYAGVHLHGRLDSMVKIRGQRIEIDEVEAVLLRHEAVNECGVILTSSGEELDAFVVFDHVEDTDAVSSVLKHCQAHLTAAAVPSRIHTLEHMPVTGTGKIDRQSLKALARNASPTEPEPYAQTGADPEKVIEQILSERLQSTPADLRALPVLREHPAFNSFVAAQVVEAVEDLLGCSADYDRFTARSFDSITSMGELFVHHT